MRQRLLGCAVAGHLVLPPLALQLLNGMRNGFKNSLKVLLFHWQLSVTLIPWLGTDKGFLPRQGLLGSVHFSVKDTTCFRGGLGTPGTPLALAVCRTLLTQSDLLSSHQTFMGVLFL